MAPVLTAHPWMQVLRLLGSESHGAIRRGGPRRVICLVVALHLAWIVFMIMWPILIGRQWDAILLLIFAAIVVHWTVLKGECVLSLLEKRCMYETYTMGEAPLRQWYHDVLPAWAATTASLALWGGMSASLLTVLWRNVSMTPHAVRFELQLTPCGLRGCFRE